MKNFKWLIILFIVILFGLPVVGLSEAGEKIYSWTDEEGIQHFSNIPTYNKKIVHSLIDRHGNKHYSKGENFEAEKFSTQSYLSDKISIKSVQKENNMDPKKDLKINPPKINYNKIFKSSWKLYLLLFVFAFVVVFLKNLERKIYKNKRTRAYHQAINPSIKKDMKTPEFKGFMGERIVINITYDFLDMKKYFLINDVVFRTEDGTTQIDHILLSQYGIFVIETKNLNGLIFGHKNEPSWTQVLSNKKFKFQNPFHQNYKHIKTLEEILQINWEKFTDIIIFTENSKFPKGKPENVFYPHEYIKFIYSKKEPCFSEFEIKTILNKIESFSLNLSDHEQAEHNESILKKKKRKF